MLEKEYGAEDRLSSLNNSLGLEQTVVMEPIETKEKAGWDINRTPVFGQNNQLIGYQDATGHFISVESDHYNKEQQAYLEQMGMVEDKTIDLSMVKDAVKVKTLQRKRPSQLGLMNAWLLGLLTLILEPLLLVATYIMIK